METLSTDARLAVDLPETSDVAVALGRFVVVGDKKARIAVVAADGETTLLDLPNVKPKKPGFEAISFDARGSRLYVFAEEARTLHVFSWTGAATDPIEPLETHAVSFGDRKNKGVEGMVHLAADASPFGSAGLLLANEGAPRGLYFLADGFRSAEQAESVQLDEVLLAACADFSGLAFDPTTRTLAVVSDESASLVRTTVVRRGEIYVTEGSVAFSLADEYGDALQRVEGVTVDDGGRVWVLLEDSRELCRLSR